MSFSPLELSGLLCVSLQRHHRNPTWVADLLMPFPPPTTESHPLQLQSSLYWLLFILSFKNPSNPPHLRLTTFKVHFMKPISSVLTYTNIDNITIMVAVLKIGKLDFILHIQVYLQKNSRMRILVQFWLESLDSQPLPVSTFLLWHFWHKLFP